MAAVAEGGAAADVPPAAPDAADGELTAEDAKKTIISLSELVDLALCTPEVGTPEGSCRWGKSRDPNLGRGCLHLRPLLIKH